MKTLFFTLVCCFSLSGLAKVEVRWMSVASIVLEDEKTVIFIDPMFTRAGVLNWLALSKLRSDEELVKSVLKDNNITKVDALFISHSHFDHSIDAPIVSKLTGGTLYVDQSSERIAKAYKEPKIKTLRIENLKPLQVGEFKITPILREHSPIRTFGFHFLPSPVPADFDFDFYDYHVGDTWLYYIEHPKGKIVIDQGSEPFIDRLKPFTQNADVLIQGIANRINDEAITAGYMDFLKPKVFMPLHFDNFIWRFDPKGGLSTLPQVRYEELMEMMDKKHVGIKMIRPEFGKKFTILE